ncbi:MAG: succinate dehydrogenase/fumarate reductase iron-sulfur subunit [Candidatus Marsarchaeota archaeon]|nr:succinate dehydrogenase/fumarate reductase iron-sulfur subunit [Candidatus Marsarchaeota archaeon]
MKSITTEKNGTATFKIFRKDPSRDSEGRYDEFEVPVEEGMSVLDGVNYIVEHIDQTLSVRWNCKAARCGSCAAEINGYPKLMCKTHISDLPSQIKLDPMGAFPLVKDLVADVSSNFDIDRRIPGFSPRKTSEKPWVMYDIDVARSQEFRKCIECFLCQDVCHVVRDHSSKYIGPRHVVKAAALDMHPMDTADRSVLLTKEKGLGLCNVTKCCQEVCPEHIAITDNAIIPEKERAADKLYDPVLSLLDKFLNRTGKQGEK